MFNGAHVVIYSSKPEEDRRFLKDIDGLAHVDAGDGWLIFALPPAEVAVHPHDRSTAHEFYFLCDDVEGVRREIEVAGLACTPAVDAGWGVLSSFHLPGGSKIGFYAPRHAQPS